MPACPPSRQTFSSPFFSCSYPLCTSPPLGRKIVTHDGAGRGVASNCFESGPREGRGIARSRGTRSFVRVQRIGLELRSLCTFRRLQCGRDQCGCDTAPTIAYSHVKAGQRPHRYGIDAFEPPLAIQPWQFTPRCELAPSNGEFTVKSQ